MLRSSTGEFTYDGSPAPQVDENSPKAQPRSRAKAAAEKLFGARSGHRRRRGNVKLQETQNLQQPSEDRKMVKETLKESNSESKTDKNNTKTDAEGISKMEVDGAAVPSANVENVGDRSKVEGSHSKKVNGKSPTAQRNGKTKSRREGKPESNLEDKSHQNESKSLVGEEVDEEQQYKYGKVLIGNSKRITAKEAEEELMSLMPLNVKLGVFLAEGGFGKVFMVEKTDTHESLVCKACMHYGKEREFKLFVQEGRMQRLFDHVNICRAYSYGYGANMAVTFLEFLKGAELFDLIPHKVGIPLNKAFDYFSQILNGVEYLHDFGFAHLDIKPENIIVTNEGVAKLVDFGHGVMYRYKEKVRPITGRRGTRPYMAPETIILDVPYDPLKVDIFSLGITLMTVVTGERIWKEPRSRDRIYDAWCNQRTDEVRQFRRLPLDLLSFLRGMLEPDPEKRKGFSGIREHIWFRTGLNGGLRQEPLRSADARLANRHMSASQPASWSGVSGSFEAVPAATVSDGGISFSQPVGRGRPTMSGKCHLVDERPERGFNPKCIMRRLTRFFSRLDAATTMERLQQAIAGQVHVKSLVRGRGDILIEARAKTDPFTARVVLILFPTRRKRGAGPTTGETSKIESRSDVLVEFRRASGDEFAFLEMYHSIYRTLMRMKVVDEDHPYLEILNASNDKKRSSPPESQGKGSDESKEKTT